MSPAPLPDEGSVGEAVSRQKAAVPNSEAGILRASSSKLLALDGKCVRLAVFDKLKSMLKVAQKCVCRGEPGVLGVRQKFLIAAAWRARAWFHHAEPTVRGRRAAAADIGRETRYRECPPRASLISRPDIATPGASLFREFARG